MKKFSIISLILIGLITLSSCRDRFLKECNDYIKVSEEIYHERFSKIPEIAEEINKLFSDQKTTKKERAAAYFLFASMPLSDIADYNPDFHFTNISLALKARREYLWGESIPAKIFLHYVLPARVNNENLDSFRIKYYDEIRSRLTGFSSIEEAALEINHWCHEKVSYQPADIRTSGPLGTILSAQGRCGEESTFTVAALRTAGIPARQVYTPRWAHTDDNHAWVEILSGGEWKYMGACEPSPVLDNGWFTTPAKQAMLVHSRARGYYNLDENVIKRDSLSAIVNNLVKYADTKNLKVSVTDSLGKIVEGAEVRFLLYNYSELFPLASVLTDKFGESELITGKGDLIVWACKDNKYGFSKAGAETSKVNIILDKRNDLNDTAMFDLTPPPKGTSPDRLPDDMIKTNNRRNGEENTIRQNYIDSWDGKGSVKMLVSAGYDSLAVAPLIEMSKGNYRQITDFLLQAKDSEKDKALLILQLVSEKDLRDTHSSVFLDFMKMTESQEESGFDLRIWGPYLLNPRIDNELLSPWRSFFKGRAGNGIPDTDDPYRLASWVDSAFRVDNTGNYYDVPITPQGVYRLKTADSHSLDIFFVALCRSLNIPSRLAPGTKAPQVYVGMEWKTIRLGRRETSEGFGKLILEPEVEGLEYYHNFTIAKLEHGAYKTLEFDYGSKPADLLTDKLPVGKYMLTTGNRTPSSKVLTKLTFFRVDSNKVTRIPVSVRKNFSSTKPDLARISWIQNQIPGFDSLQKVSGAGILVLMLKQGHEPSMHILHDIKDVSDRITDQGIGLLCVQVDSANVVGFRAEVEKVLQGQAVILDNLPEQTIMKLVKSTVGDNFDYPVVIFAGKNGEMKFVSSGYAIGIGAQVLQQAGN